jgi:hypothetical protein
MSILFNGSYEPRSIEARIMNMQQEIAMGYRRTGHEAHKSMLAGTNAARTPAEAYREMDPKSKIETIPAGEFALITRILPSAKPVNLGRKLYENRKVSDMNEGKSSMSGTIGVLSDKVDVEYDGTPVPIHDKGFSIDFRDKLAMDAEGYDSLIDYSREAERGLMRTKNNYMWNGNDAIVFKGKSWLGLFNDPSVATATLAVDLAASASASEDIRAEVARVRDIMYITNNATTGLVLVVSPQIASNWERPLSNADSTFGSLGKYIQANLRGIVEIIEDDKLVGNKIVFLQNNQDGFHAVSGMAINTYAVPRQLHNSPYAYVKFCAVGFMAKQDFSGKKTALYASA